MFVSKIMVSDDIERDSENRGDQKKEKREIVDI
jgi:hypothetical protein